MEVDSEDIQLLSMTMTDLRSDQLENQLLRHVDSLNKPLVNPRLRSSFEQLRAEHPRRFAELCKVHLSFITDVPADFLEDETACSGPRLAGHPDGLANKSTTSLTRWLAIGLLSRPAGLHRPPDDAAQLWQAESLLSLLSRQLQAGQPREGLFRKAGSLLRQRQIRDCLREGRLLDSADLSCHDTAGALKNCLADLPEPLLTSRLLPYFQRLAAPPPLLDQPLAAARQLRGLRLLMQLLPARRRCLLARLLCLLHSLSADPESRMCPESLGTVLGPALLYPPVCGWDAALVCARAVGLNSAAARLVELGPALLEIPESLGVDAARALDRLRLGRNPGADEVCLSLRFADCPRFPDPAGFTRAQLADLYTAVHCLPESGRKRRLLRRFNRCNGGLAKPCRPVFD
uniref:Rho-GAP domain-containing protein n=1 Tax=Macrostomum lignano TaxID=282301 RepID=A0A1I8GQ80_9PLAT